QEGLWTRSSYLVMLVVVGTRFTAMRDRRLLVSALLFGSVPVLAYGLLQQAGYDPVPSGGDPNTLFWPVRSSFGQHIFLGSYLVLVIPFTLTRVVERRAEWHAFRDPWWKAPEVAISVFVYVAVSASFIVFMVAGVRQTSLFVSLPALLAAFVLALIAWQRAVRDRMPPVAGLLGYSLLLLAQIAVLFFSGARGAWIAFFASLPVFGFLAALRLRQPSLARSILAVTLVGGVILVLLNIPGGPLQPLRTLHGISRLANITEAGGAGGSAQGRLLIWQGVKDLITKQPSIGSQTGGPLRLIVGYGPETLHWAFQRVYPLKLRQVTSEIWAWDRAHNIFLDTLVDVGVLGLMSFVLLVGVFFRDAVAAIARRADEDAWLSIAAAAAVAAHMVDGIFGLDMPATLLLFWIVLGVPVAILRAQPEHDAVETAVPNTVEPLAVAGVVLFALIGISLAVGTDHPALLATLWVLSILLGVAGIAFFQTSMEVRRVSLSVPGSARLRIIITLAGVILALGAAAQVRFETAAFSERDGLTALATGQFPQAVAYLEEAARTNTEEPQYRTDLGGAFLSLGANHLDSGEPAYQPVSSDAETIDSARAANLGRDQLYSLALYALQSAHALSPLDPDTLSNLGNLYLAWNRPQLALGEYQQAELLSVNNPRYLDQEALTLLQEGKTRQAADLAKQALRLDTTFWFSYYAASLVDQKRGATQQARQEAQASLGWVHNYWPPPPDSQLQQMRAVLQAG
ncbi:MAG TPA: O-antigen ligase family protein, partial [Chloroflexota bacterium]